jgi:hypothetical protein
MLRGLVAFDAIQTGFRERTGGRDRDGGDGNETNEPDMHDPTSRTPPGIWVAWKG